MESGAKWGSQTMGVDDKLSVRLTVVGHASKRWRGASSAAEAEHLNQQLSEMRARNLRWRIEQILKQELPGINIEVPVTGVGSREGFPLTGEDNAGLDRSVVVGLEVGFTTSNIAVLRRPAKIYTPSRFWELQVLTLVEARAVGAASAFMRLRIRNPFSRRELTLAGYLVGGNLNPLLKEDPKSAWKTIKGSVGTSVSDPTKWNNQRAWTPGMDKPVGQEVTFSTKDTEDFTFFVGEGNGQHVRLLKSEVGLIRKRDVSILQFTGLDTHPSSLVFEYKKGWSWPSIDVEVLAGFLRVAGDVPADFVNGTRMVVVPTQQVHNNYDAMLVTFPTGKASWNDLTLSDQKHLSEYVKNKARNIAALAGLGYRVNAEAS
jgi:hypothetical protein